MQFSLVLNTNRYVVLPRHSPTMPCHHALRFAPSPHQKLERYFQNELLDMVMRKVSGSNPVAPGEFETSKGLRNK
jgi:hypothetical protein